MVRIIFWFVLVVVLGGITTFVVTGVSLLPPEVALGPCVRDWTSPSSYEKRASPLASVTFEVAGHPVRVCYGRPSARGRQVFGGLVRYGQLWRTGANEPTRVYTGHPIVLAGVHLDPGRYSIYTIPDRDEWRVFVNRSVLRWGNDLTDGVRTNDIGVGIVPSDSTTGYVETFTIRPETVGVGALLVLEWERTRVAIPVETAGGGGGTN